MNSIPSKLLAATTLAIALAAMGCAADAGSTQQGESEVQSSKTDAALLSSLEKTLAGVTFTSEGDYGYVVFEGELAGEATLTEAVVRAKLRAAILAKSSSQRDIQPASCRAEALDIDKAIADGQAAAVPNDPNNADFVYAQHDKALGEALGAMRAQLKSVVGFTFGTNESGDQDDVGPVLYVYVGISKTTGKLIAIMTEAVYT